MEIRVIRFGQLCIASRMNRSLLYLFIAIQSYPKSLSPFLHWTYDIWTLVRFGHVWICLECFSATVTVGGCYTSKVSPPVVVEDADADADDLGGFKTESASSEAIGTVRLFPCRYT